ncbi:MAG: sarcosine oxidase subunit alpha [Actinomycetota bacterium]|nr:MAG: sarcosine oxidase subunit alpha [Actinomycetota bacterium]
MGHLDVDGRPVEVRPGDTIASAMFRAGVRTFTRSLKYHRRRGLYCLSGDCPNCLVTVDGVPGVRACETPAADGQRVRRKGGWPSVERDVLAVADHLHALLPVGFYSKTFIRPRWAWSLAERAIRSVTGVGRLPTTGPAPEAVPLRHRRVDVLVIGGGVAGLAAAAQAGASGARVLLVEEGRVGGRLAPGPVRDRVATLADEARRAGVEVAEGRTAVGIYEGPLVPVVGGDETLRVEPNRIVVATGAVEEHAVFVGNDLPGVWLGRGAARLAGVHGVRPAERAVVWARTAEALEHVRALREIGTEVVAVCGPAGLLTQLPDGVEPIVDGEVVRAVGRRAVEAVELRTPEGRRRIACDGLVVSLGRSPRDGLLRMAGDEPAVGAGEVVAPGCSLDEAEASGRRAAAGGRPEATSCGRARLGSDGIVCLCEDVGAADLDVAWAEGWRSVEILKRYTTATMGPCQGALCAPALAAFVEGRRRPTAAAAERPTARPPARPVPLAALAAGVDELPERRTGLHDRHLALGARLGRSGAWLRPFRYGDPDEEVRAVREAVGLLDVGTLGRFLIAGPHAGALVDRVLCCRTDDLAPGRSRYALALDPGGYVRDDGLLCALEDGRFLLTSTSGGADAMEAWLRDVADRGGLRVHVVNQTSWLGGVLVAGPQAPTLLARVVERGPDLGSLPPGAHAEAVVAGVACRALRTGFVGGYAVELHHRRAASVALWDALLVAGRDLGARAFGLDALDVLRLERGHPYLGQDTLPDDDPRKLGLGWAVALDKPAFVGRSALVRLWARPLERRLVGVRADGPLARGAPFELDGAVVGRLTSAARSRRLGAWIGLGWLRAVDGAFPERVRVAGVSAAVVPIPFEEAGGG